MSQAQVYEFSVEMSCSGCSGAVEKVLGKLGDKVQNFKIDLDNKKVFVTSAELTADQLLDCIKKTGKTANYIGLAN